MLVLVLVLQVVLSVVCLLVAIAYATLLERKSMGDMPQRLGPNVVGITGLLQPLADGLKLLLKETILPSTSHRILFLSAPVMTFLFSLIGWLVIPFAGTCSTGIIPCWLTILHGS